MIAPERHARYYLTLIQANPQDWQRIDAELGKFVTRGNGSLPAPIKN